MKFVNQTAPISYSAPSGFTYDAGGNLLADGQNKYLYDGEGRICAVYDTISGAYTGYIYDAEGLRVAKGTITTLSCNLASNGFTLTNQYLLDQGGDQVTELDGSGNWKHSNVWAGAHLDATYDQPSSGVQAIHFHLADPLGTRRIQANYLGVVEMNYQSLPFGDALTSTANPNCTAANHCYTDDPTEHHFTGKERDGTPMTESGNDYFQARYYNSSVGRFLSPDWSAKVEPIPYSKLGDPQSLNLYAYVENNPLGGLDPDGHASQTGKGPFISCEEEAGSGECNTSAATFQEADQITAQVAAAQEQQKAAQAQQQSSSQTDAKTAKINSRAQSQYNNDVPIIAKQLGVSTDEVLDSVHIDYDANGRAVVIGGHVNMTVDDGSDAQSALAARLGPGPHGYNENPATGEGQGSEFSRLGTTPSLHLDNGLVHVDRFNAGAWGGLGVVPHFFYDVVYGGMHGSTALLPY